jgi:3-methyladenine DNA glycosylase AlkD
MHKASGWCLREIGKKNKAALVAFLDQHAAIMPRTMLRYSIEKMDDEERKYYLDAKERAL